MRKNLALWRYVNKKIRITTDDSQVFEGIGCDFSYAEDNAESYREADSICIGSTELFEDEIISIEEID